MKLAGAHIDSDDKDGLIVSGPPSIAAAMRRIGASMSPRGWLIPPERADGVRRNLAPPPRREFKAPQRVIIKKEQLPEIPDMRNWFAQLPAVDGLKLQQPDSYTVGLRLARHSPAAVDVIKTISGRRWNRTRGQWEVSVRLAAARSSLEAALPDLAKAIGAGVERDADVVRVIYPLEHAPNIDEVVAIGGSSVRFFKSGSMFRLNEGHSRQYPSLAPYERQLGMLFYGRHEASEVTLAGKLMAFEPVS